MKRGADQIEKVPDRVKISYFFAERKEYDPRGINDSARKEQPKGRGGNQEV